MLRGYLELKLSWEMFQKAPDTLSEAERIRLSEIAERQHRIEQRILATPMAANVVVPAATLSTRIDEIHKRYPDKACFTRELQGIGLEVADLESAIARDLRVEAVLDKVASVTPPVTAVDAEIYYRLHPEAFDRPEARRLRHILITFNNPKEEEAARKILENLRSTAGNREKFAEAALRHSQCPTAMEGGVLGVIKRNQLYPALEPTAFSLKAGEVSAVLASPMGLHILRCDEIFTSGNVAFEQVQERIIERLTDKRRRETQRDWIKSLEKAAG